VLGKCSGIFALSSFSDWEQNVWWDNSNVSRVTVFAFTGDCFLVAFVLACSWW